MQIGGVEFTMGVTKHDAPGDVSTALKIVVYGMKDLETAQAVFERISATLIDMDPDIGLSRAKARSTKEERFEDFGLQLQQTMREGFLTLAKEYSDRFRVIDGHGDVDQIAEEIYAQIIGLIR